MFVASPRKVFFEGATNMLVTPKSRDEHARFRRVVGKKKKNCTITMAADEDFPCYIRKTLTSRAAVSKEKLHERFRNFLEIIAGTFLWKRWHTNKINMLNMFTKMFMCKL